VRRNHVVLHSHDVQICVDCGHELAKVGT
jgi:hypothetical protein